MRIPLSLGAVLAFAVPAGPALALTATGSCDSCNSTQLRNKAIEIATYYVDSDVHIVDEPNRTLYHYNVQIHDAPERHTASVTALASDDDIDNLMRTHWSALDSAARDIALPPITNGIPTANPSDFAANAAAQAAANDAISSIFTNIYNATWGFNSTALSQLFNTWVNQPLVNLRLPVLVTVTLASGSSFKVSMSPVMNERGAISYRAELIAGSFRGPDNA